MSEFIRIFEVVLPVILLVVFGFFGKKYNVFDKEFLDSGSKLVFKLFMPVNMFVNIYNASSLDVADPKIIIYTLLGFGSMMILAYFIYKKMQFDNETLAVMLQTLLRSNIVLFGLSIANNYFEQDQVAIVAIYIGIISAFTNSIAIVIHEMLDIRNENLDIKLILKNISKNTILIACVSGILVNFLNIEIYSPVLKALKDVASIATPLGLMCVGGAIKFVKEDNMSLDNKALLTTIIGKGIIVPVIYLTIFYLLGVTGPEMFFMIIVFASPVAVSSHALSVVYTSKGELCAKIIVYTTIINSFTIFFAIYILSQMGII